MKSKRLIAFTLIELLIVIAIVGILSGFVLVSLNSATDSANDARRKSDLSQIVKALLVYNTSNPTYPIETCAIGSTCSETVNNALGSASSITGPNNTYYTYSSDDGISFTVSAIMSNTNTYTYDSETGYSESSAEQGLPGYAKRQPITINSASALTDYQVKLTVAYDTDMQPDFDDLRFTSSDQTTELSYWLESKTDSTTATIWVKIPSLASGDNTIYMYYANASATTASNGDNTFEFFDHFDSASIDTNKWNKTGYGTVTQASSILTFTPSSSGWGSFTSLIVSSKNNGLILETYIKSTYIGNSKPSALTFSATGGGKVLRAAFSNTESDKGARYDILNGGVWYFGTYNELNTSFANTWIRLTLKRPGNASWYINNTNNVVKTSAYFIDDCYADISVYGNTSGTIAVDWVLSRKYTATEPTSSFGAEQNN